MVCAHEPTLDPRIRWEAEGAAHRFAVSVLGFNRDDGSLPENELLDGYRLLRLRPNQVSGAYYFWRLKDVISKRVRVPIGILVVLLWPIMVAGEILALLLRGAARLIIRRILRWSLRLVTVSLL